MKRRVRSTPVPHSFDILSLHDLESQRQDDLRSMQALLVEEKIRSSKEISELRAAHSRELSAAESKRLDEVRLVDSASIETLAKTTAVNAETLRALVSSTAATMATQQAATEATTNARIAALEKSNYENLGKQVFTDPQFSELVTNMKHIQASTAEDAGEVKAKSAITGPVWVIVGLVISALIVNMFSSFFLTRNSDRINTLEHQTDHPR